MYREAGTFSHIPYCYKMANSYPIFKIFSPVSSEYWEVLCHQVSTISVLNFRLYSRITKFPKVTLVYRPKYRRNIAGNHTVCLEFIKIVYSEEKISIHTLVFQNTKKGVFIHTCIFSVKNGISRQPRLFNVYP